MSKKVKRLFKQFQPLNYALMLDLDLDDMKFTGSVSIDGKKAGPPSSRLTFHQHGLTITSAFITRHDKKGLNEIKVDRINNHASYDEVRLHAAEKLYPGSYSVTMEFQGNVQTGMHGVYASHYKIGGKRQKVISTQFESHHAREAFPCIDEPEAKATFTLSLKTPGGQTAISNMPVKKQVESQKLKVESSERAEDSGLRTQKAKNSSPLVTTFETTPRMSSYLLAFVVGDLQFKEAKTKDGVSVRVYSTKAHPPAALDYALDINKKGIEFFNDYYGVPYPLPKSDNVAIPDFSSGAMENWGLITYRESILLADPRTASQQNRETAALVSLHELSHQWFGNLVTMRWWDDLWLNESFANVMEYVAADALFPEWRVWDTFISNEGLSAFRRDAIAGVQAVRTDVNHPDEISTLFDPSIVYAKGGRLLNMLMNYVGEKDFRTALKDYFTHHAYQNTTGDDLWAALTRASGKDVKAFMRPWLTRPGFPLVKATQKDRELTISQTHFTMDPDKAEPARVWPVPTLSDSPAVPALLYSSAQGVTLPNREYIRLNKGAVGHYIIHYTEPEHRAAIAGLVDSKALSEAERLMLLSDSSMLARAGVQSFAATLELLTHYAAEDSEPVWDIISLILADLRRFIDAEPALEAKIKALIRQLIAAQFKRLGWQQNTGEPVQDTKLRATIISLGVYAEDKVIVNGALELFETYKTDETAVPAELRGIIFGAAIRGHAKGAFSYLLKFEERTNNVNLKRDALGALTTTKIASEIDRLLNRLQDNKKVRLHDVDHWLVNLTRNRHAQQQAWSWLRTNWEWIEKSFSGDKSYDYFPRYAASALNTRQRLDEYTKFFGPFQDHPVLGRNVVMGIEELTTRITWLERDTPGVKQYMTERID